MHWRVSPLGADIDPARVWRHARELARTTPDPTYPCQGIQKVPSFASEAADPPLVVPAIYEHRKSVLKFRTVRYDQGTDRPLRPMAAFRSGNILLGLVRTITTAMAAGVSHFGGMFRSTPQPANAPAGASVNTAKVVIAAIDDRFGFLHGAFRDPDAASSTRFIALWDQGTEPASSSSWVQPPELGYGREIGKSVIDAQIGTLGHGHSERAAYSGTALQHPVPDDGNGPDFARPHGQTILSLAAATNNPLLPQGAVDPASRAALIGVQLPSTAPAQAHGRWLNVYVLDALHYILARAEQHCGRDTPVVVNISLGCYGGPHNGDTLLEKAIDELIELEKGRLSVVMAAGNAHQQPVHAHLALDGPTPSTTSFDVDFGTPRSTLFELWGALPDKEHKGFSVEVEAPLAGAVTLEPDQIGVLEDAANKTVALASLTRCEDAARPPDLGLFLAIGHAQRVDGSTDPPCRAPDGTWRVTVKNLSPEKPLTVHGWIGRDDVGGNAQEHPLQTELQGASVTHEAEMSNIAWGRSTIVVGGYQQDERGGYTMFLPSSSGYSAASARSSKRPTLCALAARTSEDGIPSHWFLSDIPPQRRQPFAPGAAGTSIAAAIAVRTIAGVLASHGPMLLPDLLAKVREERPSLGITPVGKQEWTSDYWVGTAPA